MRSLIAVLLLAGLVVACGEKEPTRTTTKTDPIKEPAVGTATVPKDPDTVVKPDPKATAAIEAKLYEEKVQGIFTENGAAGVVRLLLDQTHCASTEVGAGADLLAGVLDSLTEGDEVVTAVMACKKSPVNAELAGVTAGRALAKLGDLDGAEDVLRKSGHATARAPLAMVLLAKGADPSTALAALGADAEDPDVAARKVRALLLTLTGKLDEARPVLAELVVDCAEDPGFHEIRASLHLKSGELETAAEAFQQVLSLDPNSASAHRNLASLYSRLGEPEKALTHLELALEIPEEKGFRGISRPGGSMTVVDAGHAMARGCYELGMRRVAEGASKEEIEKFFRLATEAEPTWALPFLTMSELRRRQGDGPGAIFVLNEGTRPVATGEARARLMMRLAIRQLAAGNRDVYADVLSGLPKGTATARGAARLGEPDEGGFRRIEGWPRTTVGKGKRYESLARAIFEDLQQMHLPERKDFEALLETSKWQLRELRAVEARHEIDKGRPVVLLHLVIRERGPRLRYTILIGYEPGLGVFLTDDPDPEAPAIVTDADVEGGLARVGPRSMGVKVGAKEIARGLEFLAEGKWSLAKKAIGSRTRHRLADYVRCRAAVGLRRPQDAVSVLTRALGKDSEDGPFLLLLAEAQLLMGKAPEALKHLDRLIEVGGDASVSVLARRIRALSMLRPGHEDEAIARLESIRQDRPDYLPVYEDLSGAYLSRRRYHDALDILIAMGRRSPRVRKEDLYQRALARAYLGIAEKAVTADDLTPLRDARDPAVRGAAVRKVSSLAYAEASKFLLASLSDEDAGVRALAVRFIGARRIEEGADAVRKLFADPDEVVRGAAVQALSQVRGFEARGDMVTALDDEAPYVREVAMEALRSLSGETMGFDPRGTEEQRREAQAKWKAWSER